MKRTETSWRAENRPQSTSMSPYYLYLVGGVSVPPDEGTGPTSPAHRSPCVHQTGDFIRCNSHQSPHRESSNSFLGPDCFHPQRGKQRPSLSRGTQGRKIIFNVLDTHWTKVNGNFSGNFSSNCTHSNYRNGLLHTHHGTIYHTFSQYGTFTSDQFPVTDSFGNCTLQKGNPVTFF